MFNVYCKNFRDGLSTCKEKEVSVSFFSGERNPQEYCQECCRDVTIVTFNGVWCGNVKKVCVFAGKHAGLAYLLNVHLMDDSLKPCYCSTGPKNQYITVGINKRDLL